MERKVVKSCDYSAEVAAKVFQMLNYGEVFIEKGGYPRITIITDSSPYDLRYPEGWYYGKGYFRNKHESTTGAYSEIPMKTKNGTYWEDIATTCNR